MITCSDSLLDRICQLRAKRSHWWLLRRWPWQLCACLSSLEILHDDCIVSCWLRFPLTCSVDQHLPQLLLVTGMCVVKHTVSGQVKLQQREKRRPQNIYRFHLEYNSLIFVLRLDRHIGQLILAFYRYIINKSAADKADRIPHNNN